MEDNYWSIIPIDECASVDNGLVTFKECAIGKTYIVTYKNGMCESKTTINVTGESACKCTDLVVSGDKTIESDANTDIEIGTYTAGCVTDITASESADWVTSISANNGFIKASVKGNTSTTEPNTAIITVTGKAGSDTCTKTFTLTQKAKTPTCTCNDLKVSGDKTIESDANVNIEIGTYTARCVTDITASTSVDWVTSISASGGSIKATVTENTSTEERPATITVTGKAGSDPCTKEFVLTQKAKESDPCDRFEVTGVEALPFYDATYTIANFTIDVATNVGVVNSTLPSWVLSSSVVVDNDNGKITAFIERNRDGKKKEREKEITVTGKVGTETCTKTFNLKQNKEYNRSCYRGTDNGADRYEDGSTRMRPTLLCGENGSYRQDSIYIENGDSGNLQYKLNGGSWMTFGGSGFNPAAWVHVGFDDVVGCCSNKFMKIVAQSQCNVSDCIPGEYYRSVKFSFRKKNYQEGDLVPQCAKAGGCDGPANEKLCDEWEYEIKQCAVGYYWAADSESSMHSYNAYPAKCGSGKLVYWDCDCSTPVVCDCSALKVSDVESVPSSGYEAETTLARYTSGTSCGTVSKPTFVDGSGVDFVVWSTPTATKLKGTVSKNETSSEKKATYKLTQGACNTEFEIKQEAGSEQGCNVSVTVNGLEGTDKLTIQWGESSTLGEIGNETKTHTLASDTDVINVMVYDSRNPKKYNVIPQQAESGLIMSCSDPSKTITATKITPTCTCSSSNFSVTGVNVDASGGNAVLIANFTSECEPSLSFGNYEGETFIDYSITSSTYDSSTKKGKIYAKVPQNTTSSDRTEQVGVLINGETDFCKHFTVTQSGATPTTCDCDSITLSESNTAFTIGCDGTPIVIGKITPGCNIKTSGLPEWARVYKDENTNKIMFSASTYTDIDMRGGGTSIGIEGKDGYCLPISLTQDGPSTTYDVTIYCAYASGLEGVTPYVRCDGLSEPGSKYFKLTNSTVNMSYDNCKGTSASPQNWPSGREIKYCQPGQGSDEDISRGSIPTTNVVASTIEYGMTSDIQTKAVDSNMGSTVVKYHNFTYNVTIKRNL